MATQPKTILIVEDEVSMTRILQDRFELEGFSVLTAADGEAGLSIALAQHPDLIVLDILMPKMNGAEMLRRLQEDEWGQRVPVLCLTNLETTPDSIQKAMKKYGQVEYVVKFRTRLDDIIDLVKVRTGMTKKKKN